MLVAARSVISEGRLCSTLQEAPWLQLGGTALWPRGFNYSLPCVFFPRGAEGRPTAQPGAARQRRATAAPAEEQQSPGIRDVLGVYFTAKKCQKSVLFGQGFAGDC